MNMAISAKGRGDQVARLVNTEIEPVERGTGGASDEGKPSRGELDQPQQSLRPTVATG